jgi:predicted ArsR family transcriptional regulator
MKQLTSAIASFRTPRHRDRRLLLVYASKVTSFTCDEAEQQLKMSHQTCSARIHDLCADGFLIETGDRRPTRTGSPARVLTLLPRLKPLVKKGIIR